MNLHDAFLATAADLDTLDKTDELCCVFARDLTIRAYGKAVVDKAPVSLWHLFPESKDPWGPVSACVQAGIADGSGQVFLRPVDSLAAITPFRFHRLQGWRDKLFGASGHTITVYGGPRGWCVVYDSAKEPRNAKATLVYWPDYVAQYAAGVSLCLLKEVL